MAVTYLWLGTGSSISSPSSWFELSPNQGTPAGPPGPNDLAEQVSGTVSGNANVGLLTVNSAATFTGNVTASEFSGGAITANGASLSATAEFLIGFGGSLTIEAASTVNGPSVQNPSGQFGSTGGLEDFGTVEIDGFSTLKSYKVDDFDTFNIKSGVVTATDFVAGDTSASASLDIESGGSINDMLGSVGIAAQDTTVTINGGGWTNGDVIVGGAGTVTFTVSNDGTLTANGGAAAFPGEPPLEVGGRNSGDLANMTVTGVNSDVNVTGDVGVGIDQAANMTLSSGGLLAASGALATAQATTGAANFDISNGSALAQIGGDATLSVAGMTGVTIGVGGSMTVGGMLDGAQSSGSSAAIDVNGGLLKVSGNATLGDGGAGSLTLEASGTLDISGTLDEGAQSTGTGTLLFSDPEDMVTLGADWIIGDAGKHSDTIDVDLRITLPGTLTIGAKAGSSGSLELNAQSATLTGDKDVVVGAAGAGSLDVAGGASLELFSGTLSLGVSAGGAGTLTAEGTGTRISVGKDVVIGSGGAGTVTIGQNATLDASGGALTLGISKGGSGTLMLGAEVTISPGGDISVGQAGAGSIDLAANASLDGSSGTVSLGASAGGAGTVSLSGENAELKADVLQVGGAGAGVATLATGTTLSSSGDVTLGATKGGSGMVTLASGSEFSDGGNLTVGGAGSGSLDINGGTLSLTGSQFTVGDAKGGSGDVTLANASVSITGTLTAGRGGNGTFSVNTQATLNATALVAGSASGGNGTVVVDGHAAEALVGSLTVGANGTGGIQVTNGALLQVSGLASMGSQSGALVQEGATIESGANWNVGSVLDVGQMASAAVSIDSGGAVAGNGVVLGDNVGASGTVTATGSGSAPSMLGFGTLLEVGNLGTGVVGLSLGAAAGVAGAGTVEIAAQGGASGVVTLTDAKTTLSAKVLTVGGAEGAAGGTGTLSVASGALVSVTSATIWAGGTVLLAGGTLATDPVSVLGTLSGFGALSGAITNSGGISASGGTLVLAGALGAGGAVSVANGSDLWLQSGAAAGQTINLASSGATLQMDNLSTMHATVAGFALGDSLVFDGIVATTPQFSGGVLTLKNSGGSAVGTLAMSGSYSSASFHVSNANGTTDVSFACYAAGTRIATADGELPVEALCPGTRVRLAHGGSAPVVWLGHRHLEIGRHRRPHEVLPVRVHAGAFGAGLPRRDLRLSPDHAVFVDGVLIPIRYLVNGASIVRERVDAVTYFHIELPAHAVILAEGLPAESYLDTGNRGAFANGGPAVALHPDFARRIWDRQGCARLVVDGAELEAARSYVHEQAEALGHELTRDACLQVIADGRVLPVRIDAGRYRARLPAQTGFVRLLSRSAVPAETGAAEADARRLGIAVSGLVLDGVPVGLDDARLASGWHAPEPGWRWTDGDGVLAIAGGRLLTVDVAMTARYWRPCQRGLPRRGVGRR